MPHNLIPQDVPRGALLGISTAGARYTNGDWPVDGSMALCGRHQRSSVGLDTNRLRVPARLFDVNLVPATRTVPLRQPL
jgi:hypothetical protein